MDHPSPHRPRTPGPGRVFGVKKEHFRHPKARRREGRKPAKKPGWAGPMGFQPFGAGPAPFAPSRLRVSQSHTLRNSRGDAGLDGRRPNKCPRRFQAGGRHAPGPSVSICVICGKKRPRRTTPAGASALYAATQRRGAGSSRSGSSSAMSSQSRSGGGLAAAAMMAESSPTEAAPAMTTSASGRESAKPRAA